MSGLDRILGHLDDLDSVNLTNLVQRLARERGLLEAVFNTIKEGILVSDAEGGIEYANQAARQLLGLPEKESESPSLWKMVPDLAYSLDFNLASTVHKYQAEAITREIELNYPEKRVVRLYVVPIDSLDEKDPKPLYALILNDITEEKVSLSERIENEKLTSLFMLAGGVAHELGNPLNSLTIHLQLIERAVDKLKESEGSDKLKDSLKVCRNEVARLDSTIKHFLEAIRPQPPDFSDVDLLSVLEEVLHFQKPELENLKIKVEVEVKERIPTILADINQMKQLFFNVIKNSMDAMRHGGKLRIIASSDEAFVTLQIVDTGKGISQEDLSRIFEPYFTTKKEGHGLGMMIMQRIMRNHSGTIGVDSKEGVGTVLSLRFPRKNPRFRLLEQDEKGRSD